MKHACALLLLAASCGTTDNRPLTVQAVTAMVLAPTCAAATCHSQFANNFGDVFDTVESTRSSLIDNGLILFDSPSYDPANPGNSQLIIWLTQNDPFGRGIGRMPWDAPMPNEDIQYLENWIAAGAPGAQCDPARGMACNDKQLVKCNSDWNFGATVMTCPNQCISGACQ